MAEFNKIHRIEALREALETSLFEYRNGPVSTGNNENHLPSTSNQQFTKLKMLSNELDRLARVNNMPEFSYLADLTPARFNPVIADSLTKYFIKLDKEFSEISNSASDTKDKFYRMNDIKLKKLEDNYYNYSLFDIVTKPYERKKILIYNNSLVQNTDPIFLDSEKKGFLNFRTHFYAPSKYIFGIKTDTFVFNITLVLLSTVFLYLILYYELLGKIVSFSENFKFRK